MTIMKLRKLGSAIFAVLSLQAARAGQHRPATAAAAVDSSNTAAADSSNNSVGTTKTADTVAGYFVGDAGSPTGAGSREIAVGGSPYPFQERAAGLSEGRGWKKKKKKKKKTKNPSMNMMVGGSMMAAFVVIFTFLNMITVTLGKALFFTFVAKFLISVNWKSSESSSKKKTSHNDITVLMT